MKRMFSLGGVVASVILIAFGAGALVMGITGYSEVRDKLEREQITVLRI